MKQMKLSNLAGGVQTDTDTLESCLIEPTEVRHISIHNPTPTPVLIRIFKAALFKITRLETIQMVQIRKMDK